jgi:hypothetical protein
MKGASRRSPAPSIAAPRWLPALLAGLAALLLLGWFSPAIYDSDFWWHLKTGQYIVQNHRLPVPDPFAFTTASAPEGYPGEFLTRHFNLTHEWLAQVLFYAIWRMAGLGGIVLLRAVLLTAFCGLTGWMAFRRGCGFYLSFAAALAAAAVAHEFAYDRPYLITFVLLAVAALILESGRRLWLLPPLFAIWANCHGGFFLGWVLVGAYSAEALRAKRWRVPLFGGAAILASGVNPNGFRVLQVLLYYRQSFLTSKLMEWSAPRLWPPGAFTLLLLAAAGVLLWKRREVRLSDWLLFAAFGAAALSVQRNAFLMGFLAPVLIASYLPRRLTLPRLAQFAVAPLLLVALAIGIGCGGMFQLRSAEWKLPSGAADFLLAHRITQPIFNTYEYGGYLIWRLWPQERVFIDGRALGETVFRDYGRILYNVDEAGEPGAQALLDRYGVQVLVMNTFEYSQGLLYMLAPALAGPSQNNWKLVYSDPTAVIFMRQPPPGVQAIDSMRVFDHMEAECDLHIQHEPQYPRCARSLGQVFSRLGEFDRARRWLAVYLAHPHDPDPEAEQAYQRLLLPVR